MIACYQTEYARLLSQGGLGEQTPYSITGTVSRNVSTMGADRL